MVGDYELLPEKDIAKLKRELDKLRIVSSKISPENIEQLNRNINELIDIIKIAGNQMKFEETDLYSQKLNLIANKLDTLIDENKKIAEGIVAVADLVKGEHKAPQPIHPAFKTPEPPLGPVPPTKPIPPIKTPPLGEIPGSQPLPPAPQFGMAPPEMPPPPLTKLPRKKKKLFGLFK